MLIFKKSKFLEKNISTLMAAQEFTNVEHISSSSSSSSYVDETIYEEIQSNYERLQFDHRPTYVDLNFNNNNNELAEVKPKRQCRHKIARTVFIFGLSMFVITLVIVIVLILTSKFRS